MVNTSHTVTLQSMRFYAIVHGFMGHPTQTTVAFFDGINFFAFGEQLIKGETLVGISSTPEPIAPDAEIPCLDSNLYVAINKETTIEGDGKRYPFMEHTDHSHPDVIFLHQALCILRFGMTTQNRTAVNTRKVNMLSAKFDFRQGSTMLTTKSLGAQNVLKELRWMLSGDSNNNTLRATGCTIWDEWADENGNLGPVYGAMWVHWPDRRFIRRDTPDMENVLQKMYSRGFTLEQEGPNGVVLFREVNQVEKVLNKLLNNPNDRRIMITGLNPSFTPYDDLTPVENAREGQQALPPCHLLYHFLTSPMSFNDRLSCYQNRLGENAMPVADLVKLTEKQLDALRVPRYFLDLNMYQRSADFFLGVPYNRTACYQMTLYFAAKANMVPRFFKHDTGDSHLYVNHVDQIALQMEQPIGPRCFGEILGAEDNDVTQIKFKLHGYIPGIKITGDVAV